MKDKSNKEQIGKENKDEKSCILAIGYCGGGAGSNISIADVKNGKIVRIRPLHFDWKYDKKHINPWKWEVHGKTFEPRMKSLIPPYSLAYKKRVYSPNRILYPLKRVDWDPKGERNPQNRGKSKYERISWNEALDIIVSEIKRVHKQYGPTAILAQTDGHGESKVVHTAHGSPNRLLGLLGGYTQQSRNTDSWEGWVWGAKHVWGNTPQCGEQQPTRNVNIDIAENSDMLLFWGCDPETTPWGFDGQMSSRLCYFWSEVGVKSVYICPDLNYGAAIHADKWIPIRPATDAALQLAIAYIWITEGTYDKEYLKTHTVGYEKFEEYVLGKEDGVPKTPEWASPKCAVPEWTIKALAREWGSKVTSIAHGNGGPGIRSIYSTERGRLEVILLAMQGLGKPGVHQIKMIEWALPLLKEENDPMVPGTVYPSLASVQVKMLEMPEKVEENEKKIAEDDKSSDGFFKNVSKIEMGNVTRKQFIPKPLIHDAILNPPISWYGTTSAMAPTEDQFVKYTYPIKGGSEVHMMWSDSPCWITCWNDSNSYVKAVRSPKIEFFLIQHPWMESDCQFADIILPSNTKFEEEDIDTDCMSGQFYTILHQRQCVEPVGESKSDWEIVCMIAERFGLLKEYAGSQTVEEMIKTGFDNSGIQTMTTYKEFMEKDYFVVPSDPDWKKYPAGMKAFLDDPESNPLDTPSGKLEFYSERLAKVFPDDKERPPVPHWIERGETHDERVSGDRAKKYPLLQISNHGRWRVHANNDDITWTRECPTCKVKGPDGYMYEPLWMNTGDAAARGIKNGDIVRIFNERGSVLGGAFVSERIMPGAVQMDHGARYDPIIPGELDRGGAINTITPHKTTSKNATGMVCSSFLVEVEKVTMAQMEEWKKKYPAAFEKKYDPAAGLRFDAMVIQK